MSHILDEHTVIMGIVQNTFIELSESLTGLHFELADTIDLDRSKVYSAVVMSKGYFCSKTVCIMPKIVIDRILLGMNHDNLVSPSDEQAYFKEYINIIYGRTLSKLNNYFGSPSKFVVPIIVQGIYRDSGVGRYDCVEQYQFHSELGDVCLDFRYALLSREINSATQLEKGGKNV